MKKIIIKFIISSIAISGLLWSCNPDKLTDINYSPNVPSDPQTALLMTNALRGISGVVNSQTPRLYTQQISETFYTQASRYFDQIFDYSGTYNGALEDLTLIIKLNSDDATKSAASVLGGGSNANQIAAARILKAFYFLNMTDRWGDIPYSEALKGLEDVTPKFDAQQAVYTDIFKELTEAVAQFDAGTLKGDILFSGDISKWKKFANTIKLVAALHLSKKDPATGKAKFNEALAAGVISSNSDNITYKYLAESANENNVYNNYVVGKRYDYAISNVMVNKLNSLTDPRLAVYATPTNAGTYVGMPYGLVNGSGYSAGTVDNLPTSAGNISLIGSKFRQQNSAVAIYTYANILFCIAEAYKLGWIGAGPDDVNAAAKYLAGIQASMSEHGVTPAASYYTQTDVAYDPVNAIEKIMTQKWIASYAGYGYEAWTDWRRTGFPALTPTPNALNNPKVIPRRQCYTTSEKDLNLDNYNAVVASQGPDKLDTRVWWDKP
jgi:hypothetical protein